MRTHNSRSLRARWARARTIHKTIHRYRDQEIMITAFSTALSALKANSTAINVVGNDLANLNTVGYKADTFAFHDMVSEVMDSSKIDGGAGVSSVQTIRQFTQGAVLPTSGTFDAAISGNGFFLLKNQTGQTLF